MPRRTCVAIALALIVVSAPAVPRAQDPALPQLVRVARMSPWVDAEHPFRLVVQVTNATELALDDVELRVTFFSRVSSRSELRETIDRGESRQQIGSITQSLEGPLPAGDQARIDIQRTYPQLPLPRSSGVYPVEITLRHADGETSQRTALPAFATPPRAPLNVVWILPISAPIVTEADGIYPVNAGKLLGLDEVLQQMKTLADRPGGGVTLAPSPAFLDTLADMATGFATRGPTGAVVLAESSPEATRARDVLDMLKAATAAGEVAASPYAPADLPSLAAHGLADDMLRQVTLGRATLESRLGVTPAGGLLVTPSADAGTARALAGVGVTAYALPVSALTAAPLEPFNPSLFGPSRPVAVRAGTSEARVLLPDPDMSARIDASSEGVLLGQTLLAETASAFFELPLFAPDRLLVISSQRLPSPVAMRAALDGFATAPWADLRTASDVITEMEPRTDAVDLVSASTPDGPTYPAARSARAQLATLDAIAVEPLADEPLLDRLILLSQSREWMESPRQGEQLARAVTSRVRAILRGVDVARRVVTLTSRRGRAPITVFNQNPFPVRVRVRVQSPKLHFPAGRSQTLEIAPPSRQFDITVEARAAGSFPLDVLIETPDGRRVLTRKTLTVRSTTISAVALGVVGGSIGLLLFSWARRSAKRRKMLVAR